MDSDFDLKGNMAVNIKWLGIGQSFTYALQLIVWVIMARLLPPDSFGALSIAFVFSNLASTFGELGIISAIIQKKDLSKRHMDTGFWLCLAMGAFFMTLGFLCSPYIAGFFHSPVIRPLVVILAFKFLVDAGGTVHESLMNKELMFGRLTIIEISSGLAFGIISIGMVFAGAGVAALLWGYLAKSLLKVALLWLNCPFRPSPEFDRESFNELFDFGKNIVGFRVMSFISGNIDLVLIGKLLGPSALGYYSLALSLVNFPRQKLASSIVSVVAFPVFSKMQERFDELRYAYRKIVRYLSVISFPMLFGLMAVSPEFVNTVYSPKWSGMTVPLQFLCVYGVLFSITTLTGTVYVATGRADYLFKYSLVNLAGLVTAVLIGLKYGLVGISASLLIYAMVMNIWGNILAKQIIGIGLVSYFRAMLPAAEASFIMVAALAAMSRLMRAGGLPSGAISLAAMICSGAAVYIAAIFFISRKTFNEMITIVRRMF